MTSDNPHIEASASPILLTPADFADTGQWRLVIHVGRGGMTAVLRHVADPKRPAVLLFEERWPLCGERELLDRIENCVYEHPAILDDYATEIVVETSEITWVPTSILDSGDFVEEGIFSALFSGGEVMTDRGEEVSALFSLAEGFDSFMARTIPGSRMRSHLAVIESAVRRLIDRWDGLQAFLLDEPGKAIVLIYRDGCLECAAEHNVTSSDGTRRLVEAYRREWPFESCRYLASLFPEEVVRSGLPVAAALVVYRELLDKGDNIIS